GQRVPGGLRAGVERRRAGDLDPRPPLPGAHDPPAPRPPQAPLLRHHRRRLLPRENHLRSRVPHAQRRRPGEPRHLLRERRARPDGAVGVGPIGGRAAPEVTPPALSPRRHSSSRRTLSPAVQAGVMDEEAPLSAALPLQATEPNSSAKVLALSAAGSAKGGGRRSPLFPGLVAPRKRRKRGAGESLRCAPSLAGRACAAPHPAAPSQGALGGKMRMRIVRTLNDD
ncbi:hypothetical protein C7M84_011094, partial [Penaeus vannamei]